MIRRVRPRDFDAVNDWYTRRGIRPVNDGVLPEVGFIVEGVAAGWLMQTDSDICLFEGVITNPDAPSEARDRAINLLLSTLKKTGDELGFKRFVAFTEVPSIGERLAVDGFSFQGTLHLFVKEN
jgi:hypothetical protein